MARVIPAKRTLTAKRTLSVLHPGTVNGAVTFGQAGPLAATGSLSAYNASAHSYFATTNLTMIGSEFSMEAWVKVTNVPAAYIPGIMTLGEYAGISTPGLWFQDGHSQVMFNQGNQELYGPYLTLDEWYYVVGVSSSAGSVFYVNADVVATGSEGSLLNPAVPLTLGSSYNDSAVVGCLAELAVYRGVALSPTRIAAHYAARTSLDPTAYPMAVLQDRPAGYWRLGDPSGSTTAFDSSQGLA